MKDSGLNFNHAKYQAAKHYFFIHYVNDSFGDLHLSNVITINLHVKFVFFLFAISQGWK